MPDHNPDITAAASKLRRALFPEAADVDQRMREVFELARAKGGPGGALATALLEVMSVTHEWNLQAGAELGATISYREATEAIMSAIERGLAGRS